MVANALESVEVCVPDRNVLRKNKPHAYAAGYDWTLSYFPPFGV